MQNDYTFKKAPHYWEVNSQETLINSVYLRNWVFVEAFAKLVSKLKFFVHKKL
jgi:hypothetical protein